MNSLLMILAGGVSILKELMGEGEAWEVILWVRRVQSI